MMISDLVLVTGATGYIGGRLVPRLIEAGYRVRVLARDPARLVGRSWFDQVEIVQGDVLKPETLSKAITGVRVAYYLIHSMNGSDNFHQRDLSAASNFGNACSEAGVERIIYLGGLGDPESELSKHLRSRQETGEALRASGVPITEFQAAVIVGSGSVSFEMIRYLTERVPIMVCPQWVYTKIQPIAIRNVLEYLVDVLETPESSGKIIEIGGKDVMTYGDMMIGYAKVRGLRRKLLPVPVLTPRLSSYWVHLVTPIPAAIAQPLIDGLRNEVVVRNPDEASRLFPQIKPMGYEGAVELALTRLEAGEVETSWSDALYTTQGDIPPVVLTTQDGMIIEQRYQFVAATGTKVFEAFSSLGGERGWLYMTWAWRIRGIIDRLLGGVGYRRGRRDPNLVRVGDVVDFMRVEAVRPDRLMRLRAEMKVPGKAWLQFEAVPVDSERTRLVIKAFFAPKGLFGLLYWYALYPIHAMIFSGMLKKLACRAEAASRPAEGLESLCV
jgi:uncharacterized protein YbjT (DUF2867 family)